MIIKSRNPMTHATIGLCAVEASSRTTWLQDAMVSTGSAGTATAGTATALSRCVSKPCESKL